ncbi:response regulator [Variovorax sp. KK3]|uniref:hybrid sensor histidine kinase/response regulator n=1 Tax=Variovorax sp. KK3 TaxID=1855728 RepID=UPI002118004F|nr:response regulator [Variovorax sp. KK3]
MAIPSPSPAIINSTIDRSAHRILVVDDHPATRYSTSRTLRAAGFPTQEASTGREALARAVDGMSAVVLDVHLPDVDGFEVCRTLRADPRTENLPVVHLSATFVQDHDKVAGLDAGADAYLVHPAEPAVLVATLQALIRARSAEDRLRQSESRFRAIYNQVPNGMALLDAAGRFEDVNPALATLLGRTREELVGQALAEFAAPDSREDVRRFMQHAEGQGASTDVVWRSEFSLMHRSGAEVPLAWSLSPLEEPGLLVAVAIDISTRVALERARQEVLEREQAARAMAERHSRTKDDFVAVLSHELRTPLNAISGWVHILQKYGSRPELMGKALDAIARSVTAQSRIISDILDVSRVNAGKLRLHREWVDPVDLTHDSIDGLKEDIASRSLDVQLAEEGEARVSAWLDPTRFQQVVWNLLSNAIKFSSAGGVVNVVLSRSGPTLTLSVQDHGKGIAADFVPHLFDRFTQSDAPDNRMHGGLGLGLSIVKRLAELHGGSVEAFSEGEGKGATLVARFDVAREGVPVGADATTAPTGREEDDADPMASPLTGMDVLVVEDSADAAEMLDVVLHEAGAQVRVVADFDAAIGALAQRWPQLLVSDIGLPGRDGYELVREVRRIESEQGRAATRCVALTAFSRPQDAERALDAGFDAHLSKPLDAHLLLATLRGASGG